MGFDDLTPLHPTERIVMETESEGVETRVVDMVAPIGFGQRGLIVSPPRAGKNDSDAEDGSGCAKELSRCLRNHVASR